MNDEFSDRHRAIQMRLAGQAVPQICRTLHRSRRWFHTWWNRYLEFGPDGLFDLTCHPCGASRGASHPTRTGAHDLDRSPTARRECVPGRLAI